MYLRRHSTPPLLVVARLLALVPALQGCGGAGTDAPQPDLTSAAACEPLGDQLANTRAALAFGEAKQLAAALDAASLHRDGEDVQALLNTLLVVLGQVWRQLKDDGRALPLDQLGVLLSDLQPALVAALRYLATPDQTQLDAYALISDILTECPERSVTDLLALMLQQPGFISSLGALLSDPTIRDILDALPQGSGFVALIRSVINAVNSPNFVFDELVTLIEVFVDVDAPPFDVFLPQLRVLLSDENLPTVRALTVCLDEAIIIRPGVSGSDAVGALLYGLLNADNVDLISLFDQLGGAITLLEDPDTRALLDAVILILQENDDVREGIKPLIRFLMQPEYAPGVLSDLTNLIEAGTFDEVLHLLGDFLNGCAAATDAEVSP